MAPRKNLLEAFQRSSAGTGGAAGVPSAPSDPGLPLFESAAPASPGRGFAWPLVVVGLVLSFALGFVLGRARSGEARAEEPARAALPPANQPRAFQAPPTAAPGPAGAKADEPASPGRIQDSALFDLANQYTVIVASYIKGKNDVNRDLAWATYQHLADEGVPVFPPVESRNLLVVLAGAAPTKAALEATEAKVRALVRDGEKPYFDAYRVGIDTLIPRSKPAD